MDCPFFRCLSAPQIWTLSTSWSAERMQLGPLCQARISFRGSVDKRLSSEMEGPHLQFGLRSELLQWDSLIEYAVSTDRDLIGKCGVRGRMAHDEVRQMWQDFAAHGIQLFRTSIQVQTRLRDLDQALDQVCVAIAQAASKSGTGLERARSLRARPTEAGKSLYECLNQLIHYWYCCAAALHLLNSHYTNVEIRPTATDSRSKDKHAVDVAATAPDGVQVLHPPVSEA